MSNVSTENSGSFSYVNLSGYAKDASGSTLLRAQHGDLRRLIGRLQDYARNENSDCTEIRNILTEVSIKTITHFSLEEGVLHKQMANDARMKIMADQHLREIMKLQSEMGSFMRKYSTPSSIRNNFMDFSREAEEFCNNMIEQFVNEERDLFSSFERYSNK